MRAQGRLGGKPISVVDIGSNSVRLVVYETAARSPTPLFNEKVLCGLGRSVASSGVLDGEAVGRTIAALGRFAAISTQLGAGKPWIMATAAVRDASNCEEFLARVEAAARARVLLISGKREAELAAAGIIAGFAGPNGLAGDLGGGSLELIDIAGSRLKHSLTLPLGGLRLMQRSGGDLVKAERLVARDLEAVDWVSAGAGRPFYAVGGTWRAIARLHMATTSYPLRVTHGYVMSPEVALRYCDELARGKVIARLGPDEVPSARREVIPLGAVVMKRVIEHVAPSEIRFSAFGIREGLLYTLLPKDERDRDPLLAFCEDHAVLRSRSPDHAHELTTWTDRLFAPPGPEESPAERRLRHAACLLSDISWRAHPDYRGEQSLDLIAHGALTGVDHQERAFLAFAVYFRHVGLLKDAEIAEPLKRLLSKAQMKRARLVGAALRAAHMLSVGAPGIIGRTPVAYQSRKLVLTIPAELALLDGERLRRRFEALAELLGRELAVTVG